MLLKKCVLYEYQKLYPNVTTSSPNGAECSTANNL